MYLLDIIQIPAYVETLFLWDDHTFYSYVLIVISTELFCINEHTHTHRANNAYQQIHVLINGTPANT